MFNKKAIIDSLRNLNKPTKFSNKNTFDFKEGGSKKEGFVSAKEGVDTPIYKAVKVGASPIEGKGLFAEQSIKKGDVIGISHIRKKFMKDGEQYQAPFPSTVLGYYNHSEEPNVYEVDKGDYILMVAGRDIQRGQELTSDYSKHNIEDLEVPEDFKKGGATKRPKIPKGKSPKSYSRSFEATNRLFAENPLFAKPKSRKNKIFDPRSKYYANGGITYNNLPATYQSALESFIYPNVEDDPSRTGYNSVNSTISYDSESPIENMSNDWWREHEMFHHLQNIAGGMSTSGIVGQRPNPYVASDEAMRSYYDRRDADINRIVDEMIAKNPDLQFIPRHKLIEGSAPGFIGAEALQYSDPTTLEGEARQYEQYIREGNPSIFPKQKYGGLTQYAPGGYSDEPPGSKKKPYRDSKAILPRWMPKGMIKAIQNTEVGISPLMSNEQAYPMGMKKNFTDIATTGENLLGEGTGAMGVSNPSYGINFTTGLTRDISKNKGSGWALKGYLGKPYDPSMGKAAGAALERLGEEAYDKVWDEYNQDVEAYYAGTMAPSVLNSEEYGPDGWTPEAAKPKYDGKLARGLGKAMQKSPLIGGLSAHYRYDKFKQPHGYKAAGEGEIKLDWDPSNNIGLGLKGGLEFSGGNKYQSKNYKPGSYKWNINPSITAGIGTRPNFGFNLNAGVEGLPSFMPKKFPGYFYGDVNYNQSLIGPSSLSANAGMKFPLNQYKERRAKQRVQEKQKEENLNPQTVRNTTFEYGGIPVELTQDEIQKYVDGGYVVEELPKASLGKEKKTYTAPKIHEVEFKPAEIQTYNPSLKEYQIYNVELPDRIVPGREYADVKHKMANLRKDLGISTLDHMINKYVPGAAHPISLAKDSGIVIDPMSGQLFDSNTRYWLNREYGFEPNINELLFPLSSTIARDYGTLKMSSDTPFENRKMGINYMDELANPYTQKNGLLDLFGQPAGGPLMIGMGMMGKPEFTKEIKNPDYFTQLLNTFDTKRLSYSSRKYYQDLINSVKNQNGLATERQYNELQRLKTGDFNFGKRGYAKGGLVKKLLSRKRKSISQPGEWAGVKPELIQPGEEAFPLPENKKGELWYDPIVAKEMTQEELDAYNKAYEEQLKKEKFEADKAAQPTYFDEAKQWVSDWHNSPMYNKMVLNSYRGNQANADYLTKLRKKNIETMPELVVKTESEGTGNTKVPSSSGVAAWSLGDTGQVEVFPGGYDYGPTLYTHEILHSSDRPRELYKWNHPSYKTGLPVDYYNEKGIDLGESWYTDEKGNVVDYPNWMLYNDPRFPNDDVVWHDRVMPQSDQMYITTHRSSNWKDNEMYKLNKAEGYYTNKTDEELKQEMLESGWSLDDPEFARDFEEFKKQDRKNKQEWIKGDKEHWKEFGHDYISDPTEVRARLGEIRHNAQKEGIYDPFTEQITPEIFQNYINKERDSKNWQPMKPIDELREEFTDEEILWMLQNISKNETGEDENKLQYGKYGGQFELGDEVDEATMKQLMKLGYTFEKI